MRFVRSENSSFLMQFKIYYFTHILTNNEEVKYFDRIKFF